MSCETYMKSYHDMSHMRVVDTNGEHEVTRFAIALPHQETAVLAFVKQQLLGIFANNMPVKPPNTKQLHLTPFLKWSTAAIVCHTLLCWPHLAVNVMLCVASVCPSVPPLILTLIGHAAHTQCDSPGGSTRCGNRQHTFPSEYDKDGHTCSEMFQLSYALKQPKIGDWPMSYYKYRDYHRVLIKLPLSFPIILCLLLICILEVFLLIYLLNTWQKSQQL